MDIAIEDHYFIAGTVNSESSVAGLYAAGDIFMHDGKLKLIAGAFQDAANAVNKAKQFTHPDANKVGMVSSHNDVFRKRNKEFIQQLKRQFTIDLICVTIARVLLETVHSEKQGLYHNK